jgi:hypothetical protein
MANGRKEEEEERNRGNIDAEPTLWSGGLMLKYNYY